MPTIRKYCQYTLWAFLALVAMGIFTAIGMTAVVAWQVFYGDYSELEKSTILAKIKEETTLYYLDESTRIGSLFESRHRRYVPIDEMPSHMLNAIIAAEDKSFHEHFGIDLFAIGKAAVEGLMNGGHFKRGGSTITQQTVKNIIDDWEASFSRKFREMIKALQLERIYDKRQILEFYLNQFHVAGNGNGIGIAARYYFNKEVSELNLVEAAFISGSVKGPGKYNPFIKYTQKTREQAIEHANTRKNYVLGRMFEQGYISTEDYQGALQTPVPFNQGEFRTAEVALVELIRSQLEKPEVLEALELKSTDELNIAGMKVFTTIDSDLQEAAQLAIRKNLSRLETILSGFKPEPTDRYKPMRDLAKDSFVYAKVVGIEGHQADNYSIRVSLGLPMGTIPNASLQRYAKLLDLAVEKGYQYYIDQIIKQIHVGDTLFVQVVDYDKASNEAVLELQKRPKISGGMIALDKGEVRAAVSGFDTLGFNRAIHAKRQPGSLFKSLIYFAALQLGWSMLDRLDNVRQIFPYQGKFYYPRPDHKSPYDHVSMLWAGVMSENLASVSLGARLLEKLNFDRFKQLLASLELTPLAGEVPRDYHYRVARKIGVSLDSEGVKAQQLMNAIDELTPDLIFAGKQQILNKLKLMWWGNGYAAEAVQVRHRILGEISENELQIRLRLILNNFIRLQKLYQQLQIDWEKISQLVQSQGVEKAFQDPSLLGPLANFRVLTNSGLKPELGYTPLLADEVDIQTINHRPLFEPPGRALTILDVQAIWGTDSYFGNDTTADISLADVKLGGYLDAGIFSRLQTIIDKRFNEVMAIEDPYMLHRYYHHHDFRIGLGLHYVVQLSHAAGIYSPLEAVLSFPLGSNVVTASEIAKLYQTFVSGKTYRFYQEGPDNQINFIRRIEDRQGHILYEPQRTEHQLVNPIFALQMREILRKTVTHGTARRARGELYISLDAGEQAQEKLENNAGSNIRVPAFGKTGTTNDYLTSYFAGFLPYPTAFGAPLEVDDSYIISAYVGYDYNRVMSRGRQRIYGGSGALPMWTDFAKAIVETKDYKSLLNPQDSKLMASKEWPIRFNLRQSTPLLVDLPRGLILRSSQNGDQEVWQTTDIASTGESYQDPFALGSSVQSVVYMPSDQQGQSWQPLRLFGPYHPHRQEGSSAPSPSLVNTPPSPASYESALNPAAAASEAPSPNPQEEASPSPQTETDTSMPTPLASPEAASEEKQDNATEYQEEDDRPAAVKPTEQPRPDDLLPDEEL